MRGTIGALITFMEACANLPFQEFYAYILYLKYLSHLSLFFIFLNLVADIKPIPPFL